ncbi:MAG: MlaA family lipoprotein, partial [Aeromonas sp.]
MPKLSLLTPRAGVAVLLLAACGLGGCAGGPPKAGPANLELNPTASAIGASSVASDPRDPFQGANRSMWYVNYNVLERYVARPVVHAYADYVPLSVQESVDNLVENLNEPSSMVNHLLVGDVQGSGSNLGRFAMNSSVGVLGLFDVAKYTGLERKKLEFDTVLGKADIGDGAYLMLPAYGPTTTRKLVGDTVDGLYFPFSLFTLPIKVAHWTLDGLGTRAKLVKQERIVDNALDPYALTKDMFLQHTQAKVG